MIAATVVVLDEGGDLTFEIAGYVIAFQQDAVLEGLVPTLDLALGLRVIGRATDVRHAFGLEPLSLSAEM